VFNLWLYHAHANPLQIISGQSKDDPQGFDHITLVRMATQKPVITLLEWMGYWMKQSGFH